MGASTTLIRSFRIGRVLRLISKASFLKKIFLTFIVTMPSLANVGFLLVLLLYIFSILGMFLFSEVKLQNNLDRHANFQNFMNAFLTMLRCATGEAWNYIMDDCARRRSIIFDCDENFTFEDYINNGFVTKGCGMAHGAYIFFFLFTLLITMIFLNLFIAIILESFENVNTQEDLKIQDSDLELFQKVWMDFDPKGTGFIEIKDFDQFILSMIANSSKLVLVHEKLHSKPTLRKKFIEELEMPTYARMTKFHYADVMFSLTKAYMFIEDQKKEVD